MSDTLKIELLADHPEAIPALTEWFKREWAPYYGPNGPGNADRDLLESSNRDKLPVVLVAISGNETCGTVALKAESVTTHKHLTPWLAALLVIPKFRQQGVGERLIAAIEEKAVNLGFPSLYVSTGEGSGTSESSLHRRGWEFIEKSPYFVSEILLFKKTFNGKSV